ncbi:hypothetical protein ES703_121084 [subsurface metagenome]
MTNYGSNDFESNTMGLGVMLDAALEAALRLGKNFRIIARVGAMLTPPAFCGGDESDFWGASGLGDLDLIDDDGEAHALLARYTVDQSPFIPTVRVGFILNY